MNKSLTAPLVLLCLVIPVQVIGQVQDLAQQLHREQLIRIVEPVLYPLQRLQGERQSRSDVEELYRTCRFGGANALPTDSGQVWLKCNADPPQMVAYEGPNPVDQVWGDRTITVTAQGFYTKNPLGWTKGDDAGVLDTREVYRQKENDWERTGEIVRAAIVARLVITTKVIRYTKVDVAERQKTIAEWKNDSLNCPGCSAPRPLRVGEIKHWDISVGPTSYEFINDK